MDLHTLRLDEHLCDKIHPELYEVLQSLQVSKVLDLNKFITSQGYSPCIATVFLVGENPGGSYDTVLPSGTTIHVKNGTLSSSIDPSGKVFRFAGASLRYGELLAREN